jgi:hypothetical protein
MESYGGKLFDDRFFLYFEDTDLCVRAMHQDIRPLCVPGAEAVHYVDQAPSPGKPKLQLMEEARSLFFRKHYGTLSPPLLDVPAFFASVADLGETTSPPSFQWDQNGIEEACFFEIGVNPHLVPFAQAPVAGNAFHFPADLWSRLTPGRYFTRVRGRISGTLRIWQWQKV